MKLLILEYNTLRLSYLVTDLDDLEKGEYYLTEREMDDIPLGCIYFKLKNFINWIISVGN